MTVVSVCVRIGGVKARGDEVRKRREEIGLTQSELATDAGVSRDVIASIELGRRGTRSFVLRKIARALGTQYDALVGDD